MNWKKAAKLYWNGCVLGLLTIMLRNIDIGKNADGLAVVLYIALFGLTVVVAIWLIGNIREYYRAE